MASHSISHLSSQSCKKSIVKSGTAAISSFSFGQNDKGLCNPDTSRSNLKVFINKAIIQRSFYTWKYPFNSTWQLTLYSIYTGRIQFKVLDTFPLKFKGF